MYQESLEQYLLPFSDLFQRAPKWKFHFDNTSAAYIVQNLYSMKQWLFNFRLFSFKPGFKLRDWNNTLLILYSNTVSVCYSKLGGN